ncbi:MAG TPA: MFS transporter, partial [Gammaproteobacteria bacterium]
MKHFRLAAVLAFVVALGPFALDAYLPAFPAIAAALGITTGEVGVTISVYVIALAAGQLVGGPL